MSSTPVGQQRSHMSQSVASSAARLSETLHRVSFSESHRLLTHFGFSVKTLSQIPETLRCSWAVCGHVTPAVCVCTHTTLCTQQPTLPLLLMTHLRGSETKPTAAELSYQLIQTHSCSSGRLHVKHTSVVESIQESYSSISKDIIYEPFDTYE